MPEMHSRRVIVPVQRHGGLKSGLGLGVPTKNVLPQGSATAVAVLSSRRLKADGYPERSV